MVTRAEQRQRSNLLKIVTKGLTEKAKGKTEEEKKSFNEKLQAEIEKNSFLLNKLQELKLNSIREKVKNNIPLNKDEEFFLRWASGKLGKKLI